MDVCRMLADVYASLEMLKLFDGCSHNLMLSNVLTAQVSLGSSF